MSDQNNWVDKAWQFLKGRKQDYLATFGPPWGHNVLKDLEQFCRGNASTFHPDPRYEAILQGRREVWLRIANHLNLTTDELYAIARGEQQVIQGEKK